jgi:hypothetical protein
LDPSRLDLGIRISRRQAARGLVRLQRSERPPAALGLLEATALEEEIAEPIEGRIAGAAAEGLVHNAPEELKVALPGPFVKPGLSARVDAFAVLRKDRRGSFREPLLTEQANLDVMACVNSRQIGPCSFDQVKILLEGFVPLSLDRLAVG